MTTAPPRRPACARRTGRSRPSASPASASWSLLRKLGIKPDAVGGHSFGEVTALHAAGALDRKAFFSIARKRGELMAEAASMFPGAMTAVFHDADTDRRTACRVEHGRGHCQPQQPGTGRHFRHHDRHRGVEERLTEAGIRFSACPSRPRSIPPSCDRRPRRSRHSWNTCTVDSPRLPVYANSTAATYSVGGRSHARDALPPDCPPCALCRADRGHVRGRCAHLCRGRSRHSPGQPGFQDVWATAPTRPSPWIARASTA